MSALWFVIGLGLAGLCIAAPLRWAVAIVMFALPLGATQVMAVGRDPVVLPVVVGLGFAARHALGLLDRPARLQFFQLLRSDGPILAFVAYVAVSGVFFPRAFAGQTFVTPQVGFFPVPLSEALISYPQIAYVMISAYVYLALRQAILRVGLSPALYGVLAQIVFIGGIGFLQAMIGPRFPVDWVVNAQGYALMINRMSEGFVRVSAVFAEASGFGAWASAAIAFCYALYLNRVRPGLNLVLVAVLGVTMLLSTSSTAYAGLVCVGAFAFAHAVFDNDRQRRDRGLLIVIAGALVGAIASIVVFTAQAGFLGDLRNMIEAFTIDKPNSASGIERGAWAARSVQNAWETGLLGVGYGASRSSGLFASLFGNIGAPGLAIFAMITVPAILRAFRRPKTGEDAVVCAGAFGLFGGLAASAFVAPDLSISNPFWVFLPIAAAPLAQRAAMKAREAELAHGRTRPA